MKRIVLASQSPRRKEILENVNVKFEIIPSDFHEVIDPKEDPKSAVMALAFQKSWDVAQGLSGDALVIGADTVVYKDEILGKPKDEVEARKMLELLRNSSHEVYTGIAVLCLESKIKCIEVVKTTVKFKNFSDRVLHAYLKTGEWQGKAGAYGIQGFASILVEEIHGDYFNVVGLPLSKLSDILDHHFGVSIL
jgi:septum formation protein